MRILITGNAGSGKTTLARSIRKSLGLPGYGLDKIVWQPGWKKTSKALRQAQIRELASQTEWVIDGVSDILLDTADVVVFLDVSRRTSFARCVKRNWRFMFRGRPELPPNCPELVIIPYLVKLIWQFPKRVRPQILAKMQERQSGSYIVRDDKELQTVLHDLNTERAEQLSKSPLLAEAVEKLR